MRVQSYQPPASPPARSFKAPEQTPNLDPGPNPPPGDGKDGVDKASFLCGAGGALVGAAAGVASGGGTYLMTHGLGQVVQATLPSIAHLVPGTGALMLNVAIGSLVGAGLALVAGAAVGTKICNGAASGVAKPDITQSSWGEKGSKKYGIHAAELRENLGLISSAPSVKGAMAAGFRAGASIGGPAGAAAGRIQGAVFGAALGLVAALPLMDLLPHPAMLIPGAIAGAFLGNKIGEPVGYAAGAAAMGSLGAMVGGAYRAVAGQSDLG